MEFEIIDIKKHNDVFSVKIELPDKSREGFSFPYEDSWFEEDAKGNPAWLNNIKDRIRKRQQNKEKQKKLDIKKFKLKKIKE